jgi:hypothetical protein
VAKYLRKINIEEERFVLSHRFRDFSPWSLGSIASEPMVYIMVEQYGR